MQDVAPQNVLAKPAILSALKEKRIFISKFDERQLNNCSYDIRLGRFYYAEKGSRNFDLFDPYDEGCVERAFGECQEAVVPAKDYPIQRGTSNGLIVIPPGEFILAHTEEFIGCVDNSLTTMVKGRSTTGRSAIQICADAGWGDIGYANRWTLEIKNNFSRHTVVLRPGQRIGQIVFIPTTGVDSQDLYSVKGKYQKEDVSAFQASSHEELAERWDPSSMLPRAFNDWDVNEVLV